MGSTEICAPVCANAEIAGAIRKKSSPVKTAKRVFILFMPGPQFLDYDLSIISDINTPTKY